jgi:hypothetical protein
MEQMPPKKESISEKDFLVKMLEKIMAENKKNHNSWINPDDYPNNNTKEIDANRRNKFRSTYFQTLSLNCFMLLEYLGEEDKIKFRENLSSINYNVRQEQESGMPISEELVDKIDELVRNIIEKTKYEK